MSAYPLMFRVQQKFEGPQVDDIAGTVHEQLERLQLSASIQPGQSVAITAGSRGIRNIPLILAAIVDHLKSLGAKPFIVPAMGSHGGATPDGQLDVLASLGVSEERVGCPIHASMDTVIVCDAPEGFPVHFDRLAFEADHVFVCNRIKAHTGFTGDLQSGLMKMLLIGLGKKSGADIYHRAIQDYSFGQIVRSVATEVLQRCHIVGGLAVIENGYEQTALIEGVSPSNFAEREVQLLEKSLAWMPRLPFSTADLLIVDEIGKNISGTGMDTNVVGRKHNDHAALGADEPRVRYIFVRSLTEETHGNASGIGIAEFALRRAVEAIDQRKTATNCITANHPTGAMIPLTMDFDQHVLDAALSSIGLTEPSDARVMWIQNTLHLEQVECSAAYLAEAQQRDDLVVLCEPRSMPIDTSGNLPNLTDWSIG